MRRTQVSGHLTVLMRWPWPLMAEASPGSAAADGFAIVRFEQIGRVELVILKESKILAHDGFLRLIRRQFDQSLNVFQWHVFVTGCQVHGLG